MVVEALVVALERVVALEEVLVVVLEKVVV